MKDALWSWQFPQTGASTDAISKSLANAQKLNINYEKDVVLGFPGTTPLPAAVAAYRQFLEQQPNNIGFHTGPSQAEIGFVGTQDLEKEVIYAMSSLVGAKDHADVDGYICNGGTEGNDHGIWMGARTLARCTDPKEYPQGIAVLTSILTHYGVGKTFNRLLAGSNQNRHVILPTNEAGEVTPEIVEEYVSDLLYTGYTKFLFVLNAGTTNFGSVDQIDKIDRRLSEIKDLHPQKDFDVYIHVDAAFGGFVIPFLEPDYPFGFQNQFVGSISMDAHKMGYVPYGACIFLCRKGYLEKYTRTEVVYVYGHADYTVCGSRSGASAAACWAAIHTLGYKGYRDRMVKCRQTLGYLQDRLRELSQASGEEIFFYPARLTVQAVRFSERLVQALNIAKGCRKKPFCIPHDRLPSDLTIHPDRANLQSSSSVVVHRFVMTPTVTTDKIDIFISALREALTLVA